MEIINTPFDGLFVLQTMNIADNRGCFQKLFDYNFFMRMGLSVDFKEFYYSLNKSNVVRGMHFQTPPFDCVKVVYVSKGSVVDVVLDLRKESDTYGHYFEIGLNSQEGKYVYIPKGFAHGFKSLEDDTIVNYAQTACYNKEHDCGIDSMSIGYDWGENVIRSARDLSFPTLCDYKSPFI